MIGRKWREEAGGPVLRSLLGKLLAKVTYTGSRWRGTTWTDRGTSSATTALNISYCDKSPR